MLIFYMNVRKRPHSLALGSGWKGLQLQGPEKNKEGLEFYNKPRNYLCCCRVLLLDNMKKDVGCYHSLYVCWNLMRTVIFINSFPCMYIYKDKKVGLTLSPS